MSTFLVWDYESSEEIPPVIIEAKNSDDALKAYAADDIDSNEDFSEYVCRRLHGEFWLDEEKSDEVGRFVQVSKEIHDKRVFDYFAVHPEWAQFYMVSLRSTVALDKMPLEMLVYIYLKTWCNCLNCLPIENVRKISYSEFELEKPI